MDLQRALLDLEEQFWRGDAAFYERNLTDDAVTVMPEPVGVLTREQTIEAIAGSPRWVAIAFRDVHLVHLTEDAVIVIYHAEAHRGGEETRYAARVSSAYVRREGAWKLAFHRQVPEEGWGAGGG